MESNTHNADYDLKTNETFQNVHLKKLNFNVDNINKCLSTVQEMTNLLDYDAPMRNKMENKNKGKKVTNKALRKLTFRDLNSKVTSSNRLNLLLINPAVVRSNINGSNKFLLNSSDAEKFPKIQPNSVKNKNSIKNTNIFSPIKKEMKDLYLNTEGTDIFSSNNKIGKFHLDPQNTYITNITETNELPQITLNNNHSPSPKIKPISLKLKKISLRKQMNKYLDLSKDLDDINKQVYNLKSPTKPEKLSKFLNFSTSPNTNTHNHINQNKSKIESEELKDIIPSISAIKKNSVFLYHLNKMVSADEFDKYKDVTEASLKKDDEMILRMDNIGAYKFRKMIREKYGMENKDSDRLNLSQKWMDVSVRKQNHENVKKLILENNMIRKKILKVGNKTMTE